MHLTNYAKGERSKMANIPLKASSSEENDLNRESPGGSQALDFSIMQAQHTATVKARRRNVESQLRQSHAEGFGNLKRRHDEDKASYEENLKQAQRPHLDRLAQLLERKQKLEIEIERLCENLERADSAVAEQLSACIRNRVDALRA
ncbi:hypothetical protein WHR41_02887 [Cladosporium halotolerans]|uniref:Uncharacterized protein n=1 Tax=Cladosporium halotolerans TaxID=1052096 RepID=A0AB34KYJ7_9PEZI